MFFGHRRLKHNSSFNLHDQLSASVLGKRLSDPKRSGRPYLVMGVLSNVPRRVRAESPCAKPRVAVARGPPQLAQPDRPEPEEVGVKRRRGVGVARCFEAQKSPPPLHLDFSTKTEEDDCSA